MKKAIILLSILLCIALAFMSCNASNNESANDNKSKNNIESTSDIDSGYKSVLTTAETSLNSNECTSEEFEITDNELSSLIDYSNFNNLPQSYLRVIKNEKTFLFMDKEMLIDSYKSPYLQKHLAQCDNVQYSVLDMDGDGKVEVLISSWAGDILVLHEENGIIHGVDFTFRSMCNVRTDGSYYWNTNQGDTYGCSKLSFRNGICSAVELCRVELDDNDVANFFINGVKVTKDEYDSFFESLSNVGDVTWYKLSIFPTHIE